VGHWHECSHNDVKETQENVCKNFSTLKPYDKEIYCNELDGAVY